MSSRQFCEFNFFQPILFLVPRLPRYFKNFEEQSDDNFEYFSSPLEFVLEFSCQIVYLKRRNSRILSSVISSADFILANSKSAIDSDRNF